MLSDVGVVIIGRNEGEKLCNCIESVKMVNRNIVYVDSRSTDGSLEFAKHWNNSSIFRSFAYFHSGKGSVWIHYDDIQVCRSSGNYEVYLPKNNGRFADANRIQAL